MKLTSSACGSRRRWSHQIVVHAEAYGEAQEHDLLEPMVELTAENFRAMGDAQVWSKAKLTADAGFHTERNLEYLSLHRIDGYVADNLMQVPCGAHARAG